MSAGPSRRARWHFEVRVALLVKVGAITLSGMPISPVLPYRVTVNSFLADGGDNYGVLTQGTSRIPGNVDTDAFENYLRANPGGIAPGPQNRITRVP